MISVSVFRTFVGILSVTASSDSDFDGKGERGDWNMSKPILEVEIRAVAAVIESPWRYNRWV